MIISNPTNYSLENKLGNVNSVDACYDQAKNSGYKYFGLKHNPEYEVIFYQHYNFGGTRYFFKVGEYSDVTPGNYDSRRPGGWQGKSPQGNRIGYRWFKHRDYGWAGIGMSKNIPQGGLSGMMVPKELKVTLYSQKNFRGQSTSSRTKTNIDSLWEQKITSYISSSNKINES